MPAASESEASKGDRLAEKHAVSVNGCAIPNDVSFELKSERHRPSSPSLNTDRRAVVPIHLHSGGSSAPGGPDERTHSGSDEHGRSGYGGAACLVSNWYSGSAFLEVWCIMTRTHCFRLRATRNTMDQG